jgi:hypothetical protein
MWRETKTIKRATLLLAWALVPLSAFAQEEGPREIQLPNPMGAHTWFIIIAVGAFLAWCISFALQLQRERLTGHTRPQRESLLRRKEELLNSLAKLESQKDAGNVAQSRYEKDFKKLRSQLSDVLGRLKSRQNSTES